MKIGVTHYTRGNKAPVYFPPEELMTVEQMLSDMMARLTAGAQLTVSGFCHGLITYDDPEDLVKGWDKIIYGVSSPLIEQFLIGATRWWQQHAETRTSEHERFMRLELLATIQLELTDEQRKRALEMSREDFVSITAMMIESGEGISELFND